MYIMECGHIENAKTLDNKPFCAICSCDVVAKEINDTNKTQKFAKCHCGKIKESSPYLPFFKEQPNSKYDSFYCGCDGWD